MMFDAERYLREFGIPHSLTGQDISPGWVGISCPFCRDHGTHGGFGPEGQYSCWRCGWHSLEDVIARLERVKFHEACQRVAEYQAAKRKSRHGAVERPGRPSKVEVPGGKLEALHKSYLRKRNFDPDYLEGKYQLRGTGPVGPYKFRLIAPVLLDGEVVSYQGRDVTGKAENPYKACPKDQEIVDHKDTLYNVDSTGSSALVVEGIFDAWRLGDGAVATFGVGFSWSQVEMMAARYRRVVLLYDGEPKAQARARRIVLALAALGVESKNALLRRGDPAELSPDEAARLKEELLK